MTQDFDALAQVASFLSGGTPSKANPQYWNGLIPWLTPKDMSQYDGVTTDSVSASAIGNGTRLAPSDALFIAVRGMSLHSEIRIVRAQREMAFNQDIKAIVPRGIDRDFLFFALQSRIPELLAAVEAAGHGTGRLPTDRLESLTIPRFGPAQEKKIGSLFGAIDDKIELNRRMNETLEAMAQAIFRDWFVDFGPTRRKLAGIADPIEIMGGLVQDPARAASLAALFPDALGDDGLPVGWEETAVGDLFEINPTELLARGKLAPYADMASLPTSGSTADPPIERAFGSGMKFKNGDALLARITPCLENGKAAFVDFLPDDQTVGWGSTEFIVFRSRPPVPKAAAYLLVRHSEFRAKAVQSMTGTSGRQRAQADNLRAFKLARAPEAIFREAGAFIEPLFAEIRASAGQSQTLAATRDLLLPKLMSGEIRLRDAKAIVEAPT